MTIQPTPNGGILGDFFRTGQPGQGFDFQGLIGNPLLHLGVGTLSNNGDLARGLQQALVAGQLQAKSARDARRDERDDKRFAWEQEQHEATQAQRQRYNDMLGADNPDNPVLQGLTPEQRQTALMMGPENGARYIAQIMNQPSYETVQNPFGRGGVGQRNTQTGQITGYQAPIAGPKPTTLQQNYEAAVAQGYQGTILDYQMDLKRAGATNINMPKDVNELVQTTNEITRLRGTGNPADAALADRLEMSVAFGGGKPPESYIKAAGSIRDARDGISRLYNTIQSGAGSSLSPTERASVAQDFQRVKLAYAELTNRGANFTESEEAMVSDVLGGNPNDLVQRLIQGDEAFLRRLQNAAEVIEQRGASLLESFTRPIERTYTYPWQQEADDDLVNKYLGAP